VYRVYARFFKPRWEQIYSDMRTMEDEVRVSDVDWTIVRPSYLTNGRHSGRYRVARDFTPPRDWRISRADVADFLVKQPTDETFIRGTAALAY
jgi:putative NADH-flavin reductase